MPLRDKTGPEGKGPGTGRGMGGCITEKQLETPERDKEPDGTTEKQLGDSRGRGQGGAGRGGQGKGGGRGRRKGPNGITYFT